MAFDFVIVGLGNPGPPYEGTRHNAGADLVRELAGRHGIALTGSKYRSITGQGAIAGRHCLLALPQTYMNLSGQAVKRMISYTSTPPERLVVAHDDLDLPVGRIRLRRAGGSGGHRGVGSIMENLGEQDFIRVRIGIGRPEPPAPAERYVLSRFTKEQGPAYRETLRRAALALESIFTDGLDKAMSTYNSLPGSSGEPPPRRSPP